MTLAARLFANIPFARKLTLISMLSSGVALLLACATFVTYELVTFRDVLVADTYSHAAMIGHNSAAALLFDDPGSAERTLASFTTQPQIVGAALYGRDGAAFASYRRPGESRFTAPAREATGHRFAGGYLELFYEFAVAGEPAGTVYMQTETTTVRERLQRYTVIGAVVMLVSSLVAMVLSTRLQRAISGPVSALTAVVNRVRWDHDYSVRARKSGDDELGTLIDGFNGMLDQIQGQASALQEARDSLEQRVVERTQALEQEVAEREAAQAELQKIHDELMRASRQAGMAEVATNVLHNVGNVLNSVNVTLSVLTEQVERSRVSNLQKLAELLREHRDDLGIFLTGDARGKQIPGYVTQLAEHLAAERAFAIKELASLRSNVDHIKGIVTTQQDYARVAGVQETTNVTSLFEDALRITAAVLQRHGVQVVRDYAAVPAVNTEKHKVLQILVNLVRNAADSCAASGRPEKRITVRVRSTDDRIRMSVIDNGVGIPAENMTQIFAHGFTTKKDGHGFGLHFGALAAREIGGELVPESEGPDRGATFTLELPYDG